MGKREYNALVKALRAQRVKVTASKSAAKKFLDDAGVSHIMVPKGTNKARTHSDLR